MNPILLVIILPVVLGSFLSRPDLDFINLSPYPNLYRRDFTEFTCWLACTERATPLCFYYGFKDVGSAPRPNDFTIDPIVPRTCQQLTTRTYNSVQNGWDRGHMVAANHMDHSTAIIKESFHFTNMMPQTAIMNRQAYQLAEEIFECHRDIDNLKTIVGFIMGTNTTNDYFVTSHGVRTPDWFFRIIEKEKTGDVIAWIFPNDNTATKANIDKYLVRIRDIENRSGFIFNGFTQAQKEKLLTVSWSVPENCDKS